MIAATLAPLRHPVFRAIWCANLASSFGTMIQTVGAAWVMTSLSPSAVMVALVQSSSTIPIMLLALLAGAIADSCDRRRVMLAAQAIMLVASALLALLAASGAMTAAWLLVLTLAVGIGTALNAPSWQASIRDQVPPGDVPAAIALNSIGFNLARSMGPAIGGLLVAFAGPTANFALNALSYLAVIVVLARWTPPPSQDGRKPLMAAVREGMAYAVQNQPMRHTMVRAAIFGTLTAALWALMPLVARDLLHGGSLEYGLLLGTFGIGSIFGAFLAIRGRSHLSNHGVFTAASLGFALATAALGLSSQLAAGMAAAALAGSCWVSALSTINIAVQTQTPRHIVGRCLALYYMAAFGGLAIGSYAWGLIADGHGIAASLLASALLLAGSTIVFQRFRLPGGSLV